MATEPTAANSPLVQTSPTEWATVRPINKAAVAEEAAAASSKVEEEEILHACMKAGSVAQIVVAAIAVVGLIYLLKVVLVTVLTAMLLAFALEPIVHQLAAFGFHGLWVRCLPCCC